MSLPAHVQNFMQAIAAVGLKRPELHLQATAAEGASTPQDCGWVSRLTLKLMLLSRSASWSLLFSALRPTVPPDVIVEPHDYAFLQADELLAGVFSSWRTGTVEECTAVLNKLLVAYEAHQIKLIEAYGSPRLRPAAATGFRIADAAVQAVALLTQEGSYDGAILCVRLRGFDKAAGASTLAQLLQQRPPQVWMTVNAAGAATWRLAVDSGVASTVGTSVPTLDSISSAATLQEGLAAARRTLENWIATSTQSLAKRRMYVAALLTHFNGALVEYDVENFRKASFLLEHEQFRVLVTAEISNEFPEVQPVIRLQSIYHDDPQGHPLEQELRDYAYSPRWEGLEMAQRLKQLLTTSIPEFRKRSFADVAQYATANV